MATSDQAAQKFDSSRAEEYERQSRIALAGYEACHELSACLLAASLGTGGEATILVGGAGGTANEILTAGALEPGWRFVAVDPAPAMLDLAIERVTRAGLGERTKTVLGTIGDLPGDRNFDAATLIGVLHHLPGEDAKRAILADIAARLPSGAPFVLACNHYRYASQPLLLTAWGERRARRLRRFRPNSAVFCRAPIRLNPSARWPICSRKPGSNRPCASSAACSGAPGSREKFESDQIACARRRYQKVPASSRPNMP
jgi:tRNA (cmo5U34)-methyltransferase